MLGRTHPRCSPNGGAASGVRRAAAPIIVPVVDPRIYSNLRVWFDARLGVHRTSANLTQWDDQSGNAINLTLLAGMTSPQYAGSVPGNGRPGFTFAGTQAIGTTTSMSAQPATIFGVIRTGAAHSGSINDNYSGGGNRWFLNTTPPNDLVFQVVSGLHNTNLTVNTNFVFCCVANGASSSVTVNSITVNGDIGAGALGSLVLGGIGSFGNATTATIQTFFLYNTLRTAPEIAAILAALKSDWGAA